MKTRQLHYQVIAIISLLTSGCADISQKVDIAPIVHTLATSEGKDISVAVRVTDERLSKSLGRRGSNYGPSAEITSEQDIAVIVQKEIIEGLHKKGFEATDDNGTLNTKLSVEVRLLEYSTFSGFWKAGVNIKGALKAVAVKNGKTYEKIYRTDKEESIIIVPTAETNEKWINDALSNALEQLVDDNGLMMFLTQTK